MGQEGAGRKVFYMTSNQLKEEQREQFCPDFNNRGYVSFFMPAVRHSWKYH